MEPSPSAAASDASGAGVPSPRELYTFLKQHLPIKGISYDDPDQPLDFWKDLKTKADPFSDELVVELRGAYRKRLIEALSPKNKSGADQKILAEREKFINTLRRQPREDRPTSRDLFQVAGTHMEPRHRFDVCMRMAGVTQQALLNAMRIEDERPRADKALNAFLNHPGKTFDRLPLACQQLDVHAGWVEDGLKYRGDQLLSLPVPWWLVPWYKVCELAKRVFDRAAYLGLLPYRDDLHGYDFTVFWARWRKDPAILDISANWKGSSIHLLPWIFEARECFRCGDLTYVVTFTPSTYQILRRVISHYLHTQMPEMEGHHGMELPPETLTSPPRPDASEMMELLTRLDSPTHANLVLSGPEGRRLRMTPVQVAPPGEISSRHGEVKPGRPKGSKTRRAPAKAKAEDSKPQTAEDSKPQTAEDSKPQTDENSAG